MGEPITAKSRLPRARIFVCAEGAFFSAGVSAFLRVLSAFVLFLALLCGARFSRWLVRSPAGSVMTGKAKAKATAKAAAKPKAKLG